MHEPVCRPQAVAVTGRVSRRRRRRGLGGWVGGRQAKMPSGLGPAGKIGRASCRERVCQYV